MSQEQIDMIEAIDDFSYGRYTGRSALISKFCMTYITLSQDYKKVVLVLGRVTWAPLLFGGATLSMFSKLMIRLHQ